MRRAREVGFRDENLYQVLLSLNTKRPRIRLAAGAGAAAAWGAHAARRYNRRMSDSLLSCIAFSRHEPNYELKLLPRKQRDAENATKIHHVTSRTRVYYIQAFEGGFLPAQKNDAPIPLHSRKFNKAHLCHYGKNSLLDREMKDCEKVRILVSAGMNI